MRRIILILFPLYTFAQGSLNVELLDNWHDDNLMVNTSEDRYNDCWGFVQNGQEYAAIGSTEGLHFFRISDDNKFELVDSVAGKYQATTVIHRDIKIHNGYAYAVCDEGTSSLQIIDLQFLPDSVVVVNQESDFFTRVHNVFIDETNDILYSCGGRDQLGFDLNLQLWDISDPLNISMLYSSSGAIPYTHDAYVRNSIAYLNCGDNGLRVYDFSDPSNPIFIQNLDIYQEQGYNHQGWMTPDGTRFIFGDETNGVKLKNCTVNADHTITIDNYFGTNDQNGSIPHNIMLSDEFAFVAYYNEGLRIYDIRNKVPKEIAFYDTYPDESAFKMEGAWGIYSELPSGRLLISDRKYGLFLFDFRTEIFRAPVIENLSLYPNPAGADEQVTIKLDVDDVNEFTVELSDMRGRKITELTISGQTYIQFTPAVEGGMYRLTIRYLNYLGEEEVIKRKLIIK